jgi:DNA processing protein
MILTSEERLAYVTLAMVPGIGATRLGNLAKVFGSWTGALTAPVEFLGTVPGIQPPVAAAIGKVDRGEVERMLAGIGERGEFLLTPFDPDFPDRLRDIDEPPVVLFGIGKREWLADPAVAIVGSRHPTGYGVFAAREIARMAAEAGLVVVSGMARGLDAVAHWAAVDVDGRTIGVLGNGIGVIYPKSNQALYQRVSEAGLLLTEHPPGQPPHRGSFPARNRLISGLARATVVVEAAVKSGALSTAAAALAQNRDVFGVPGNITSPTSRGVNLLLRDGALVYLEPDDLLARYPEVPAAIRARFGVANSDEPGARLCGEVKRVWEVLDRVPRTADDLAMQLDLPTSGLLRAITELELAGLVTREGAGFRRHG